MNLEFLLGMVVGLVLALLSIFVFTKIQANEERLELSAALREQSQLLLTLQKRRRYSHMGL